MKTKTCQNAREACHEPIGNNPLDLCEGCLWWNAVFALRNIVKDHVEGHFNHEFELDVICTYFEHRKRGEEVPHPIELQNFCEAIEKDDRNSRLSATLTLESYLIKHAPEGVRDNQPSVSDILNLPF